MRALDVSELSDYVFERPHNYFLRFTQLSKKAAILSSPCVVRLLSKWQLDSSFAVA